MSSPAPRRHRRQSPAGPDVLVYDGSEELASAVAAALLDRLAGAQAEHREPHLALTGGTIADLVHAELARLAAGSALDWSGVHVWWGDERFVAADSPDRNAGQARAVLLDVVPVDPAKVHEMGSAGAFEDVDAAAAAYDRELERDLDDDFEVVLLGMGPDGHVASLFPGHPQLEVEARGAVGVTGSPKPPPERVSLTFPMLNRARSVWFLVTGDGKADAVARALAVGDNRGDAAVSEIPARGVHGRSETVWHLDAAAASQLPD